MLGIESSISFSLLGAKVPSMELLLSGAKVRGSESSIIRTGVYEHSGTSRVRVTGWG